MVVGRSAAGDAVSSMGLSPAVCAHLLVARRRMSYCVNECCDNGPMFEAVEEEYVAGTYLVSRAGTRPRTGGGMCVERTQSIYMHIQRTLITLVSR